MRSPRRGARALLAAALLALSPAGAARAQEGVRGVALETSVAAAAQASCPTPAAVSERLAAYLRESETIEPIAASIHVAPGDAGGFVGTLELVRGDASSRREVTAASCADVLEACTLVVAIAADAEVASRAPPASAALADPAEAPERVSPSPADADPEAGDGAPPGDPTADAPLDPERPGAAASGALPEGDEAPGGEPAAPLEVWAMARVAVALSFGLVPDASAGAALDVGARIAFVEASLGAHWHSETERASAGERGGRFAAYVGTARVGVAFAIDALELAPAIRLDVGALTGRGYGVSSARDAVTPWVALGGGLEVRFRWRVQPGLDLAAVAGGDVMAALVEPTFVILGSTPPDAIYTPPPVNGAVTLGLRMFLR